MNTTLSHILLNTCVFVSTCHSPAIQRKADSSAAQRQNAGFQKKMSKVHLKTHAGRQEKKEKKKNRPRCLPLH